MFFKYNQVSTGKSLSEALLFAEHGENMFCTKIVLNVRNNFCKQHVLPSFELLSYCGLVDSKIRASDKDLPVNHGDGTVNPFIFAFTRFICTVVVQRTVNQTKYLVPRQ